MKVTSFKWLGEKMTVTREQMNNATEESVVLQECEDLPTKGFFDALEAVRQDLLKRAGITTKKMQESIVLTGVRVIPSRAGSRQFSASITIQWGYGPAVGSALPLLIEGVDQEEGERILSAIELRRIDNLLDEAGQYAAGKRKARQMDAFEEEAQA